MNRYIIRRYYMFFRVIRVECVIVSKDPCRKKMTQNMDARHPGNDPGAASGDGRALDARIPDKDGRTDVATGLSRALTKSETRDGGKE